MLKQQIMKVLIVSTGITGAVTASLLRNTLPEKTVIHMVDKSRGSGGRMSTHRSNMSGQGTVDLGAQYISHSPSLYPLHKRFYDELQADGVMRPFEGVVEGENNYSADDMKHFVSPDGMGAIVKHFLAKAGAEISYSTLVRGIHLRGDRWQVETDSGAVDYDSVLLTLPIPQVLQLQGDIQTTITDSGMRSKFERVTYSSRFAVGLFYQPGTELDIPWTMKYFADDPIVRYVALDDRKRNAECDSVGPTVVIHTTVPFGLKHLEADKDTVCRDLVMPRVLQLLPQLPPPSDVKYHKWRYSQVHRGYEGEPGCVLLHRQPLLLVGGDAFTRSTLDGCLASALALTTAFTDHASQL